MTWQKYCWIVLSWLSHFKYHPQEERVGQLWIWWMFRPQISILSKSKHLTNVIMWPNICMKLPNTVSHTSCELSTELISFIAVYSIIHRYGPLASPLFFFLMGIIGKGKMCRNWICLLTLPKNVPRMFNMQISLPLCKKNVHAIYHLNSEIHE